MQVEFLLRGSGSRKFQSGKHRLGRSVGYDMSPQNSVVNRERVHRVDKAPELGRQIEQNPMLRCIVGFNSLRTLTYDSSIWHEEEDQ